MEDEIRIDYFEWLYSIACGIRFSERISYRKLLTHLHAVPFRYLIAKDQNRAENGKDLRYRYALICNYSESIDEILDILEGPCSVLEMIIALAISCEEDIMDDPNLGNRTGQWFWGMINNLGLGSMMDDKYDEYLVDDIITTFLNREYQPDGRGGLFTIRGCDCDLRDVEIWIQMCWYLDSIM